MLVKFTYTTLISYWVFVVLAEIMQNTFTVGAASLFYFLVMSSYGLVGLSISNSITTEFKTVSTLKKMCALYFIILAILVMWMFFSTINSGGVQYVTLLEMSVVGLFFAALLTLIYKSSEVLVGNELRKGINNRGELFTCLALFLLPISIFSISKRIERLG